MKFRVMIWLFLIAGVLWMLAGLRDAFAPVFFSFSSRVVTSSNIVLDFAVAAVFFALAWYSASGSPHVNGNGK